MTAWKVVDTWRFDHAGKQRDALVIVDEETNGDVLSGKDAKANADLMVSADEMKAELSLINSVARAHLGYGGVGGDWAEVKEWTDKYRSKK